MAERLAAALEQNTSVTSLNLRGNGIGRQGAELLAAALEQNTSVTTLDLWDNDIGDPGAEQLAAALEQNTSVTTLKLGGNGIGDQGAKQLAAALEQNTNLTTLSLTYERIRIYTEQIQSALNRNQSGLMVLTISCEMQGAEQCTIIGTNMGGSQAVRVEIGLQHTIAMLKKLISQQLHFLGILKLVHSNGALLDDPDLVLANCLPSLTKQI